jgi:hypothetical protein
LRFTAQSLLATLNETTEDTIWSAVRALQEGAMLLEHLAQHARDAGQVNEANSLRPGSARYAGAGPSWSPKVSRDSLTEREFLRVRNLFGNKALKLGLGHTTNPVNTVFQSVAVKLVTQPRVVEISPDLSIWCSAVVTPARSTPSMTDRNSA